MNARIIICMLLALLFSVGSAPTAQPIAGDEEAAKEKEKDKPKPPDKEKQPAEEKKPAIPSEVFDTSLMGPQFATGFNPHMMGDFPGWFVQKLFTFTGSQTTTKTTTLTDPIVNVSPNTPIIVTSFNHGLVSGQTVTVSGVNGIPGANGTFQISVIDKNRFILLGAKGGGGSYLGGGVVSASTTTTTTTPVTQTRSVVSFAFAAGSMKIAENESPRPQDRVFFTYNFFSNLHAPGNQPGGGTTTDQTTAQTIGRGRTSTNTNVVTTTFPTSPIVTADLHREVFGFEKTFFGGDASVELRLPLLQQHSDIDAFRARDLGDLTVLGKWALINNRQTGNVFTVGFAVTAPTGPTIETIDGNIHSTWLQPWFGYIWNAERVYLHAFHSIVVPTDSRDVTMFFNDVGLNFWLYRTDVERPLRYIVPMIEAHVTTPLNHRDMNGPVFVPDLVVLTGGVHFGLFNNGTLSVGAATPITGPRIYNIEAFLQLNWRF